MARPVSAESFAADLLKAAASAPVQAWRVVKDAAQRAKDEARENVRRSAPTHNAGAAGAITYDEPMVTPWGARSEVGYDKDLPGGALGNILEFGGGGDHSPAHRDIGRAADNEESRFGDALQAMAAGLL